MPVELRVPETACECGKAPCEGFHVEEEDEGDDLCDNCMRSGVTVDHTHNGDTVCTKCAKTCLKCTGSKCQNCGAVIEESELLPIADIHQRVAPGEPMPSGECPKCGALCHEEDR